MFSDASIQTNWLMKLTCTSLYMFIEVSLSSVDLNMSSPNPVPRTKISPKWPTLIAFVVFFHVIPYDLYLPSGVAEWDSFQTTICCIDNGSKSSLLLFTCSRNHKLRCKAKFILSGGADVKSKQSWVYKNVQQWSGFQSWHISLFDFPIESSTYPWFPKNKNRLLTIRSVFCLEGFDLVWCQTDFFVCSEKL